MIPHDGILLTDDGYGWALLADLAQYVPARDFPETWLDRPCDTCDGDIVLEDYLPTLAGRTRGIYSCGDCIDGRRTWTAQIECVACGGDGLEYGGMSDDGPGPHGPCPDCIGAGTRTVRLSVVPNMVLPIVELTEDDECSDDPHVCVFRGHVGGEPFDQWTFFDGTTEQEVTLPDAAKPGYYAVRVRWENVT